MAELIHNKIVGTVSPHVIRKKVTYENANWDMERVWYIKEGFETPRLVYRAEGNLGTPLTHNMTYMYVVPHVKGTMNYMGLTWRYRGTFFSFPSPPANGELGQEVTYSIPKSAMQHRINNEQDGVIDVVWFASGVRDVDGAGGFSGYNDQSTRTITVGNIASATVNFYFTQRKYIPTTNYKASISTPDGIVDLLVKSPNASNITFTIEPDFNLGLILVPIDDDTATQIRVATPDGIKSLKAYNEYNDIEMRDD